MLGIANLTITPGLYLSEEHGTNLSCGTTIGSNGVGRRTDELWLFHTRTHTHTQIKTKHLASCLLFSMLGLPFHPEDGSRMFL
jgi:hypothetical protein